ncbi:MAG: site-2 protease family protein [Gammaproteobacteria bacterium CG22_combo_CG10-13_8_21_14_all_40_8]|nr:MAG: site-2 protease family protein [Gammaproteobacteria bacterium CG22_combo_CG10-13_8_21_14_all_40_8]
MINLLFQGRYELFAMLLFSIILSLTFHEFGHAITAKHFGDDTAQRMGRLTLNPWVHIDLMGLLMVATIGFGYAKPVPINPSKFNSPQASLWVSAAGPGMNLLLAIITLNIGAAAVHYQMDALNTSFVMFFLQYLALINLLLMLFNLLPIGPLDGHYILPYFMKPQAGYKYLQWNQQYGTMILFGLIALSFVGIPIFSKLMGVAQSLSQYLIFF